MRCQPLHDLAKENLLTSSKVKSTVAAGPFRSGWWRNLATIEVERIHKTRPNKTKVEEKTAALASVSTALDAIASGAPDKQPWFGALVGTATFLQVKKQIESTVPKVTKPKELVAATAAVVKANGYSFLSEDDENIYII